MIVSLTLIAVFLFVIVLGMPIGIGMGIGTMASLSAGGYDISTLPLLVQDGANDYTLVAIPYFILAANIMNRSSITNRIFDFCESLCCWMHGGLAQVNVLASVIFAGISGTSSGDAAGLGMIEIEAMTRKGYDRGWSCAVTMASSILGPIIPPSVAFIVYASLTGVSVTELFVAGVVPGLLLAACLMVANTVIARSGKVACPPPEKFSIKRVWQTFKDGFWALLAPIILLVSLFSGVITATETGIIAVVYALIAGAIYKEIHIKDLIATVVDTVQSSAIIMFMIGMGNGIGYILTLERLPHLLTEAMLTLTTNKYVLLFLILIFLTILGMFLEATVIRIITVPLLLPVIQALGIDLLHFGVVHTLVGLLGTMTPPVGTGLMIMCTVAKMKFSEIVKSTIYVWVPLVVAMLIITYVPIITTWLPNFIFN